MDNRNIFRNIFLPLLVMTAAVMTPSCQQNSDNYIVITGFAQGGTYSVKANIAGTAPTLRRSPQKIKDGVDSVLLAIDNSLSGYNKNSTLSRFNSGKAVVPDDMFTDIYSRAYRFWQETDGAVDVAAGPLFDIWGFGFTSGSMPSDTKVGECLAECGMGRLKPAMREGSAMPGTGHDTLSPSALLLPDAGDALPRLNYNAIAQGYTCDIVADYLYNIGVTDMLVDIGGEIYCNGLNPSGQPWSIGIDRPVDGNQEAGADIQAVFQAPATPCGIVTSGNYRKFYIRDGKKYAHTIDPRTGYPVSHTLLSATIITKGDATAADAYATYCMVIGLEKAVRFITSRDDLEGYLIYDDNGTMKSWASDGFVISTGAKRNGEI